MDENKLNPNSTDPVENEKAEDLAEEINAAETEAESADTAPADAEEQVTEEAENDESAEEADETADEDTGSDDADEETEEETAAEENAEPVKKKKRRGAKALIAILVFIMVIAIAGMVAVIYTAEKSKIDLEQHILTVDNVDSKAAEFYQAYMYYYSYNSYYQYSAEELKELSIDQLILTNSLYAAAIAEGYSVDGEIKAQIEEQLASITATAEASSITADEYLNNAFCPGFTLAMFEEILTKSMVAQEYYSDKIDTIKAKYDGENGKEIIEAEYAENKFTYDLSDVSYWYFDASEEDAQAKADAIVSQVNGGKSFDAAIQTVTGDAEAIHNNLKGHSQYALKNGSFVEDAIEWIFEKNEDGSYKNGTGSVTTVSDDSKVYVFYVNNAPQRDEVHPVDVAYIKIDVDSDTSIKTEKELKIEAKSVATGILNEFEETDKSVESFEKLIAAKNNGDNKLVSGDIFELMANDGSVDKTVEAWAFDEDREVNEYALVESEDCYYILFFENKAENPVWYDSVRNSLINNDAATFENDMLTESKAKAEINEEAVDAVIYYVNNVVAAQYGY